MEYRASARKQANKRMIIAPLIAVGFVWIGRWCLPEGVAFGEFPFGLSKHGFWVIAAHFFALSGLVAFIREVIFALRSFKSSGDWLIRLSANRFLWVVPNHANGREVGFDLQSGQVDYLELRRVEDVEHSDKVQHWLHPQDGPPFRLRDYSGIKLAALFDEARDLGYDIRETLH